MKIVFTIMLVATSFIARSQNPFFQWAKGFGGGTSNQGLSVITDASGNVYTTGSFQGTADFDPGPGIVNLSSSGDYDIFILKLDVSGNFVWVKSMGSVGPDQGMSIALDAFGSICVTGMFQGTVDFDTGPGVFNLISVGSGDIFISKLNPSGNFVFAKGIGGASWDYGSDLVTDAVGNIFVTGAFNQGTVDFDPGAGVFNLVNTGVQNIFILKLDVLGNFIWAKGIGDGNSASGQSIALDGAGNVYTTGNFNFITDFDPGPGTYNLTANGNFWDVFVLKLDASGNFVWAKGVGGTTVDMGTSVVTDNNGNVYVAGYFQGPCDFDPGAGVFNLNSAGSDDAFILKLDVSGNFVWVKLLSGTGVDIPYSVTLDASGNIYTTGIFQATTDFDPGTGTFLLTSQGSSDIFISKLDGSGNFVWAKRIGDTGVEYAFCITTDASGNIYSTGRFQGTVDFDPNNGIYNLTSPVYESLFIHKLGLCSLIATTVAIKHVNCPGNSNGSATVTATGGGPFTYSWNPSGGNAPIASGLIPNAYSCIVTNSCGNMWIQNINIIALNPNPTVTAFSNPSVLCVGQNATLTAAGASSYSWSSGGTSPLEIISPTVTSTYTLTGTDAKNCINSTVVNLSVVLCTAVSDLSLLDLGINIFPNPTSGIFNLEIDFINNEPGNICITNTLGEVVFSEIARSGSALFNISALSNGIYFVSVKQNSIEKKLKLIKE